MPVVWIALGIGLGIVAARVGRDVWRERIRKRCVMCKFERATGITTGSECEKK